MTTTATTKTKLPKKPSAKTRPVLVSSLGAKLLGHCRVSTNPLSSRNFTILFPAFNSQELVNALTELVDKQLLTQRGNEDHATFSLTDYGRTGRVAVS